MSVDILMATYNGGRYLRNQLLSLQQQTYEPTFRINASIP